VKPGQLQGLLYILRKIKMREVCICRTREVDVSPSTEYILCVDRKTPEMTGTGEREQDVGKMFSPVDEVDNVDTEGQYTLSVAGGDCTIKKEILDVLGKF
jgi:hypothetical protein